MNFYKKVVIHSLGQRSDEGRFSAFCYKDQSWESELTIWYFCFARKTGIIQYKL